MNRSPTMLLTDDTPLPGWKLLDSSPHKETTRVKDWLNSALQQRELRRSVCPCLPAREGKKKNGLTENFRLGPATICILGLISYHMYDLGGRSQSIYSRGPQMVRNPPWRKVSSTQPPQSYIRPKKLIHMKTSPLGWDPTETKPADSDPQGF